MKVITYDIFRDFGGKRFISNVFIIIIIILKDKETQHNVHVEGKELLYRVSLLTIATRFWSAII